MLSILYPLLYVVTISSHSLYFFIWNFPQKFINLTKNINSNPVCVMYYLCVLQKLLQFTLIFIISYLNKTLIPYLLNLNLIKILLILTGQTLNMSVYSKLGITGVYYGNKFGYKTKWITSFPYNILSNPQYVGCILTFLGLYGLIDTHYIIYSIILYLITMYFESLPSIKPLVKKTLDINNSLC